MAARQEGGLLSSRGWFRGECCGPAASTAKAASALAQASSLKSTLWRLAREGRY